MKILFSFLLLAVGFNAFSAESKKAPSNVKAPIANKNAPVNKIPARNVKSAPPQQTKTQSNAGFSEPASQPIPPELLKAYGGKLQR